MEGVREPGRLHQVFQTFDWLAKWQRHIGRRKDTVPAIVLGGDAEGQLLFILQLAIERRGPLRCLSWLGSGPDSIFRTGLRFGRPRPRRKMSSPSSMLRSSLHWRIRRCDGG